MLSNMILAGAILTSQANGKTMQAAETPASSDLPPGLRLVAERLNSGFASPLFKTLAERKGDASAVGLAKDELELILKIDLAARMTLRHWLTRPRQEGSPPPKVEDFYRSKAFVVGHMEAIALECVLTPEQTANWRKLANKPIMASRDGRYPLMPLGFPPDSPYNETRGGYLREIHRLAREQDVWIRAGGCSDLFRLVRNEADTGKWGPLPKLTARQAELASMLDAIARDAQKKWLLRGTNGVNRMPPEQEELSPTAVMISRLSESGKRVRASIVSHAEEVLLDAVLEPNQRTELKRRLWIKGGVFALLDPELAATLRLAKWQRDAITPMLEDRAVFWRKSHDLMNADNFKIHAASQKGLIAPDEESKRIEATWAPFHQRMANYDAAIWDILSTAQSRTLAKILRKPIPKKEDEKTKKKSSRAG